MHFEKQSVIEKLTGIQSSKKSYYVELKSTMHQTELKNKQLEVLNHLAKSINIEMSFQDMLESAAEKLAEIIPFHRMSLSLLENNQLLVTTVIPADAVAIAPGNPIPARRSLFWEIIENRGGAQIINLSRGPLKYLEANHMKDLGMETMAVIPLFLKGKVIGVLNISSKIDKAYNDDDLVFLKQLADQLAICVYNTQLYSEVVRRKVEWEETFRAVADLLLFIDLDYTILRYNHYPKDIYPVDGQEIIGRKCYESLNGQKEPCPNCIIEKAIETRSVTSCQRETTKGKILEIQAYPVINQESESYGVIKYCRDITHKKTMEAQLLHSAKLAAVGQMAAGVAHELNNPLTAILGNSQLLLRDSRTPQQQLPLLEDINYCGARCQRIIKDLLTFSRRENAPFQVIDLKETLEKSIALFNYQLKESKIDLETKLGDRALILGNSSQLEQVLINLLINSKDALREEKDKKISITANICNKLQQAEITVRDNGCGMSKETLSQIFNPFFTTKSTGEGTGLGLSLSLGIIESHGGIIQAESLKGEGSSLRITLPLYKG